MPPSLIALSVALRPIKGCFAILGEEQVIPPGFARDILSMVGLRNRLVHEYTEIDHDHIHAFLTARLGDFATYARHIVAYVENFEIHTENRERPASSDRFSMLKCQRV